MTSANKDAEIRLTGDSRRSPVYFFIFSDLLLLTAEVLPLHFLRRCIFFFKIYIFQQPSDQTWKWWSHLFMDLSIIISPPIKEPYFS